MRFLIPFLVLSLSFAQEKPIPPPGVAVPDKDRAELEAGLARLSASIEKIKTHALAADVIIFRDAVRYALVYNEFFKADEIGKAKDLLKKGQERADALARGSAPWAAQTGL
ncbi:MAG: hypothetical protein HYZ37_18105, partial [Candidatus Solibacter usitatus]|nr:hypothetical protein [Candidatus Solibacter usitatus]